MELNAAPSCTDGWTAWGVGGCYKLFEIKKGGKEAEDYCDNEQVFIIIIKPERFKVPYSRKCLKGILDLGAQVHMYKT